MPFLGAIVQAILQAVFTALAGWRRDKDRIDAHERAATSEAATETQQAIAETADERSKVPDSPSDAGELARQLRAERTSRGPGSSGKRPF